MTKKLGINAAINNPVVGNKFSNEVVRMFQDISDKISDQWSSIGFNATVIKPIGLAGDPDIDTTNGVYLFDSLLTEVLFFSSELPRDWKEGTILKPYIHWQKTTSASGNVKWRLEYKWAPVNEVMDSSFTSVDVSTVDSSVTDDNTADKTLLSGFGDISTVGKQINDILILKLSRIGGDAADTYGADARFLEFDIYYQKDTFGSKEVLVK